MSYLTRAAIVLVVIAVIVGSVGLTHPQASEERAMTNLFAGLCALAAVVFLALAWRIQ